MPSQKSTANSGNIEKFKINSNVSSRSIDLSAGVGEIRYYESIMSNAITASAVITETGFVDSNNPNRPSTQPSTLDWLPIRGGERVDFVIEDAQEQPNQISFSGSASDGLYVNRVKNVVSGTQQEMYTLDLSSKEYFSNDLTRVTKRYDGSIAENVKTIVEEVLEGTWADGDGVDGKDIDITLNPYNFIGNTRKPFYICTWLGSKAVPQISTDDGGNGVGGAAGYLFYQTRDGYHFKSLDIIWQQAQENRDNLKKYIYNNTGDSVEGYDANVVSYNINQDIDLNEKLVLGTYNNTSIFFDYYAFNYETRPYTITDQQESGVVTAAEDYSELVAEEFRQSPSRGMSHIMDFGVMPSGTSSDEQLEEWKNDPEKPNYDAKNVMVQSIMRYQQVFTISVTIVIPADFSIKAGDVIVCDFPTVEGTANADTNEQTGGLYMVASVCHRITPRETFTSLDLVRDSFGGSTSP